jgi:hypothetical protein
LEYPAEGGWRHRPVPRLRGALLDKGRTEALAQPRLVARIGYREAGERLYPPIRLRRGRR